MSTPDPLSNLLPPNSLVETKVAIGSWAGIITGLVVWGLTYWIPAWHQGIPGPLLAFLPMAVAWLLHTGAAYLSPHTSRPDLRPPPMPTSVQVPIVQTIPPAQVAPALAEPEPVQPASSGPDIPHA